MKIDSYIDEALRSEKPLTEVRANHHFVYMVLELLVAVGTIADLLKKEVVYGAAHNDRLWDEAIDTAGWSVNHLRVASYNVELDANPMPINGRLLHAALGVAGETSEIIEQVLDSANEGVESKPLDLVNIAEEAGDTMWYMALLLDFLGAKGIGAETVLQANIDKLKLRFPDKFSLEASQARDTAAERVQLERSVA